MMSTVWSKSKTVLKCWAIICAGCVSSFIFPPFFNAWAGYIALIGFFSYLFLTPKSRKALFGITYLFGFAFYVVGFSWISNALLVDAEKFAGFIPVVFVAIGAFFGLFWAVPALFVPQDAKLFRKIIIYACGFVLMEWVRSFIFTGFPWNLLGSALCFSPDMIRAAAYIGTYGLSLLLMLFCLGISLLIIGGIQRKFYVSGILLVIIPVSVILGAGWVDSLSQSSSGKDETKVLVVRLVQPSIPQTFKWNPSLMYKNFRQYIELSKKGPADGYMALEDIDMVVWGETATPYLLDRDEEHRLEIKEAIPQNGFLVTGVLRVGMENGQYVPYNSMFVLDDRADIKDYYDKSHLVPFGEYLPFREYLPDFMAPVAEVVGNLGKGEKYKNIQVSGLPLMGGAICYESIFPKEIINPEKKPEVLLVLANDGWYGISAGPSQHLAAAQLRAVEEGVTVIRSANTGISAVIDVNGHILDDIGLNEVGVADVILNFPFSRDTIYGKYGNKIPLSIILLLLLCCMNWGSIVRKRQ